jgi:hypothetical protein
MATDLEMLQLIENLASFDISPRYQGEFQDDLYFRQGMVTKVVNLICYGCTVRIQAMLRLPFSGAKCLAGVARSCVGGVLGKRLKMCSKVRNRRIGR